MRTQKREEWEIREDARTLARAEEIKADKQRAREAYAMASTLANEELQRVNGMLKVAGKQPPKVPDTEPKCNTRNTGGRTRVPNPATIGRL